MDIIEGLFRCAVGNSRVRVTWRDDEGIEPNVFEGLAVGVVKTPYSGEGFSFNCLFLFDDSGDYRVIEGWTYQIFISDIISYEVI